MHHAPGESTSLPLRTAVIVGSAGAAIIGLVGLLGYVTGLSLLSAVRPGYIPMAPSTAFCFLILSLVLFRHSRKPLQGPGLLVMLPLVAVVLIFGLLVIAGIGISVEAWFFPDMGSIGGFPVGRMSLTTGVTFVVAGLGASLLLLRSWNVRLATSAGHSASTLGVLAALIGATFLLSYVYGAPLLYSGTTIPMAATTAIAFVFLGTALVAAAGPASFPTRHIIGDTTSARLSRVFVPFTVAVVLIAGAASHLESDLPVVNHPLILAALAVVVAVFTVLLITRFAHAIGAKLDASNRQLRESQALLASIVTGTSDAIYVKDLEGKYLLLNQAGVSLVGKTEAEVLGRDDFALFPPHEAKVVMAGDQRVLETQSAVTYEELVTAANGTSMNLLSTKGPIRDRAGRTIGLFGIAHDITDRKRKEAERERLVASLQDALAQVKTLAGLVPICSFCKKIRDDENYWHEVESYVSMHTDAAFSHGVCPDCMRKHYPEFAEDTVDRG